MWLPLHVLQVYPPDFDLECGSVCGNEHNNNQQRRQVIEQVWCPLLGHRLLLHLKQLSDMPEKGEAEGRFAIVGWVGRE